MKVLFVHSSAGMYGADRCLLSLARKLISRGNEVHVVVPEDGTLVTELKKTGVRISFIDPIVFRREVLTVKGAFQLIVRTPVSVWKIFRLIRKERFNLVHSNTSVTLAGAVAARLSRTPHVWHFREILTEFGPLFRIYEPLVNLLSTRLIFITQAVENQFSSQNIRRKGRVIHDGIPIHDFNNAQPEKMGSDIVITSVGRLAAYKGQDVLVSALAEAHEKGIELEAYIVGEVFADRHAYKESLIALTDELGMREKIHFVGFQQDIKPFLERCNIFVMPANRQEPLGIVMLEAMAASRAVIATNGGGVSEIISDSENGVLVQVGSSSEMAKAIIDLARDPDKRRMIAERGHEIVNEKFSEEAMFSSVIKLYEEILGEEIGDVVIDNEGFAS